MWQPLFLLPAMRARSRQPVKRYKKLIADIFPRNQEEGPNDRKIGKLCEYAAKNPLRIRRCYKELRIENFQSAKIVMCIYRKLLITCKEQMPLFASSLLSIISTLLDQTRQDDIQVIGCETLFDFVNNQKDGTFMFNLEGFIPKLCQFTQEEGKDERDKSPRAAGLQALSSMIWFMGQHSHISVEFDNIVSVVLENYGGPKRISENLDTDKPGPQNRWVQEVLKNEGLLLLCQRSLQGFLLGGQLEEARNPCFWSRVCLHNMAKLGKEATTIRRVLESLFRYFDNGNLWSPENGLAFPVLKDMQFLMDNSGQNTHVLLSILIKHLDHKNVLKEPSMQLDIVEVTTALAEHAKVDPSLAIIGAVSDVMRHLRKSIHCSLDDANLGAEIKNWNKNFREVVDKCLVELAYKVGEAGPILDIMAVMLENISNVTVIARTTISTVYRTAQISFPETLFHQLLPAMVHPDHETRVGAHRIFSVVLVPSSVSPRPSSTNPGTVSVFSSSAALFDKLRRDKTSTRENVCQDNKNNVLEGEQINNGILARLTSSTSRVHSMKNPYIPSTSDENPVNILNKETPPDLSFAFIDLDTVHFSCKYTQNYEAIAIHIAWYCYSLEPSDEALIRSFQLAFSLRNIALKQQESLSPSRRRSLFTLATSMILFSSKAFNIIPLIYCTKAVLTEKMVDPFLHLVEDRKLEAVTTDSGHPQFSALKSLSEIDVTGNQSREFFAAEIAKSLANLANSEVSAKREKLLDEFLPDDVCPLGAQLFMDTPNHIDQVDSKDNSLVEGTPLFTVDDVFLDSLEGQTTQTTEIVFQYTNLLSVNQLLESVLETTHQVGRLSVTAPDVSYKEMAHHCETLQMGKQQKMSHVMSVQLRQESLMNVPFQKYDDKARKATNPFLDQNLIASPQIAPVGTVQMQCATEYQHLPDLFRLPASSPFDNFLKAAVTARGRCLAICFLPSGPARVLGVLKNMRCAYQSSSYGSSSWCFDQFIAKNLVNVNDSLNMSTKYIVSALVGSFAIAYVCDYVVSDKKIFGGTTPRTVSNKEWWEETDKKFQAWPRTGGPPVVMNPITRQNFIVKSQDS
ncbi:protein SEMI-ROLLED LEAF 2 [Populus alba x Populus x berolinensis]|nr:protein SEMI-ROLLED LEAF 2 [Populus alba x Populus x berolinensis]